MTKLDPRTLYDLVADPLDVSGAVLLQALDGFVDAGSTTKVLRSALLGRESTVIARFDVDQLHDYRSRRPVMHFDRDHWASVDVPELAIYLLDDTLGQPYLLLAGPEPDMQWERFVSAMIMLVADLGVRLTVGFNAFPMALPHTRPTRVIVHGTRPELLAGYTPWLGQILVPASAGHLMEFRLGEAGHDALGLAAPVPPYVVETEYPAAAVALLREASARTGLRLPVDSLDDAAARTRTSIDEQVAENDDLQRLVQALEEQYDAYLRAAAGTDQSPLTPEGRLPSPDELGAELERFLAEQAGGGDPPRSGS
jgi:PAC2 family